MWVHCENMLLTQLLNSSPQIQCNDDIEIFPYILKDGTLHSEISRSNLNIICNSKWWFLSVFFKLLNDGDSHIFRSFAVVDMNKVLRAKIYQPCLIEKKILL